MYPSVVCIVDIINIVPHYNAYKSILINQPVHPLMINEISEWQVADKFASIFEVPLLRNISPTAFEFSSVVCALYS